MPDNKHKIELYFNDFNERVAAAPTIIAETSTEDFRRSFTTKSYDGKKWLDYQSRPKPVIGSLLVRSSRLVNSIRPAIVSDTLVRISAGSSRVPYAKVHNEGGTIRKKVTVRPYTHPNLFSYHILCSFSWIILQEMA